MFLTSWFHPTSKLKYWSYRASKVTHWAEEHITFGCCKRKHVIPFLAGSTGGYGALMQIKRHRRLDSQRTGHMHAWFKEFLMEVGINLLVLFKLLGPVYLSCIWVSCLTLQWWEHRSLLLYNFKKWIHCVYIYTQYMFVLDASFICLSYFALFCFFLSVNKQKKIAVVQPEKQ